GGGGAGVAPPGPAREGGPQHALLHPARRQRGYPRRRSRGGRLMSTAVAALDPQPIRGNADARPGLARLTAVELRKMVDTRAGFWLQLGILGLTITFVVLQATLGHTEDHTRRKILEGSIFPAAILLPIVAMLLV